MTSSFSCHSSLRVAASICPNTKTSAHWVLECIISYHYSRILGVYWTKNQAVQTKGVHESHYHCISWCLPSGRRLIRGINHGYLQTKGQQQTTKDNCLVQLEKLSTKLPKSLNIASLGGSLGPAPSAQWQIKVQFALTMAIGYKKTVEQSFCFLPYSSKSKRTVNPLLCYSKTTAY